MNFHNAIMAATTAGEQFTTRQLVDRLGLGRNETGHVSKALKTAVRYGFIVQILPRGPHFSATWRRLE